MDYLLVILFLCVLLVGVSAHIDAQRAERHIIAEAAEKALRVREAERLLSVEREETRKRELYLRQEINRSIGISPTSTVFSRRDNEESFANKSGSENMGSNLLLNSSAIAQGTNGTPASYPRYEDVTAVRYENARLGFVMELPKGWYLAYEYGQDLAFGSELYAFGVTLDDMKKLNGALWMRVTRPCTSTEATSTIFTFGTTTNGTTREASSCIPPFFVHLGYRTDAPYSLAREQFLLNLARTFYPIVSPTAP